LKERTWGRRYCEEMTQRNEVLTSKEIGERCGSRMGIWMNWMEGTKGRLELLTVQNIVKCIQ
jgi:hypothetical protein